MADTFSIADFALPTESQSAIPHVAMSAYESIPRDGLIQRINDWQLFFSELPGQNYALYLEDAAELAAALWGAWHAGKIVVLPGDRLTSTLKPLSALTDGSIGEMPSAIAVPAKGHSKIPLARSRLDLEQTGVVIFTSGSTGEPNAIEKKLRQLQAEVMALEASFGNRLGDAVIYGTVSHQHIYGLLFRVLWPLTTGRRFFTHRLEFPEQFAKHLANHDSVLIASPAHLKRLPESIDWQPMAARLKAVFSSGGPLSAESSDFIAQLWRNRPIEVLGSSETGGIAWRQSDDGATSWQPLPGVEWRIADEHLQVRSPHISNEDWFITQDRAALHDGNKFELLGRSDRIIKLEERRISLTAIEKALLASAWIHECKLLVLPGQRERLAAVAVLNASGKQLLQAIGKLAVVNQLRACLEGMADPIAIPRHWRFPDALPSDSQGKTSQRMLAELFRVSMPSFKILHASAESAQLELSVSKDLVVFDGHFSQQAAVVPGVALIDWAIKHGRQLFAFERRFLRIEALKFQQVIRPDSTVNLDLQWSPQNGALKFRYESGLGVHANGRILFSLPENGGIP